MLETSRDGLKQRAFFNKYPNAIKYESNESTITFGDMHDQVRWGKENLMADAMVDMYRLTDTTEYKMIWYLTDEADAMAVKLRYE